MTHILDLHGDRLNYWTCQYENEKKILLDQYANEMDTYKNRKFQSHKELECVFYALESEYDAKKERDEQDHLEKIDDIKSKVNKKKYQLENFLYTVFFF